ncbi:MAG: ornithine cyclodeaminase [Gemmobacter sp.]|jgi:ornithine cyclodeaminase|nr:ornithine cyclodeaminase [Gemmobacter sp.]
MFHLDEAAVHAGLPWRDAVDALRRAHATQGKPFENAGVFDAPDATGDQFVNLTAWSPSRMIAVKMVGVFPGTVKLGRPEPSIQGLVALFDGMTGRALMTCDGAAMTYRKTAADSALGADLLARKDADVLAIAGAGGLAPHVIEAHCAIRPITRVILWNRNRPRAEAMAETLRRPGREVVVVDDLTIALPEADIVSAVTMATSPVIAGSALKPGAHVDLVGAYLPDMREADADTVRRAGRMFTDNRRAFAHSGDGAAPVAEGLILGPEADYFDLCTGRHPGRRSETEITVCKNIGGGYLDLFVTEYLYSRQPPRRD